MWAAMQEEELAYPEFSAEEMSDLMTYLYFSSFVDEPGDATEADAPKNGEVETSADDAEHDASGRAEPAEADDRADSIGAAARSARSGESTR